MGKGPAEHRAWRADRKELVWLREENDRMYTIVEAARRLRSQSKQHPNMRELFRALKTIDKAEAARANERADSALEQPLTKEVK